MFLTFRCECFAPTTSLHGVSNMHPTGLLAALIMAAVLADGLKPLPAVRTKGEWATARKKLIAQWDSILGGPLPKVPSTRLETFEEETLPTVIRRHVRYQTEP